MNRKRNIIIVGAGEAGIELLELLNKHLKKNYSVAGFVDDDQRKKAKKIKGKLVLGDTSSLSKIIRAYQIEEVFIAIPSAEGSVIRRIIDECNKEKTVFKIVPRLIEIILGKVKLQHVREIELADLLGRPIIKSELAENFLLVKGKRVLVTGAAGSIGSELFKQLLQLNPKLLIGVDIWESGLFELEEGLKYLKNKTSFELIIGNVQDNDGIKKIFQKYKPEIIFHAAAYKHVPLLQKNIIEGIKNNILGTENLAKISFEEKVVKFINISTDKAVDPVNVLGATKLAGERIVEYYNSFNKTKFISVRFGNVLDSQGSVLPVFRRQINQGGPVTITDPKMTRYFMTIPEAVQLVLQAAYLGKGGEVFVLDMGKPVKIQEVAKLMIRLSGYIPDVDIAITYTGKRPGEKLHEVLVSKREKLIETKNEKIYKIKKITQNDVKILKLLESFKKVVKDQNDKKSIDLLKSIAPKMRD